MPRKKHHSVPKHKVNTLDLSQTFRIFWQLHINQLRKPKWLLPVIVVLLLLSTYLRIEPAIFNTTHFSFDQGLDAILVKRLVEDHKISLVSRYTGLEGVLMGPWYTWIMAVPAVISGGNPNFDVVFMSMIGILSVIGCYIVMLYHTNLKTALLAGFFVLFSTPFLTSSRIVLSPAPLTFITFVYIHLILEITLYKKIMYLPFLSLLCGFFFQFEVGYAVFATIAALLTVLIWVKQDVFKYKSLFLSLLAFIFPFIPQIIFDFRHDFLISSSITKFIRGENTSLGTETGGVFTRVVTRLTSLYQDGLETLTFGTNNTILSLVIMVLFSYGLSVLIKKHRQTKLYRVGLVVVSLIICTYIGFMFFKGPVWQWYRAGTPMLFAVLASLALAQLPNRLIIGFVTVITIVAFEPRQRILAYRQPPVGVAAVATQQQTLDSIYSDAQGKPFALYVYTPPVYPYIWDYQLYWYALKKFGYLPYPYDRMPQKDNPELVYLLVEPDDIPPRIDGWKGNFKSLGEPLTFWDIPGGVRVEKWRLDKTPQNPSPLIKFVNVFDKE